MFKLSPVSLIPPLAREHKIISPCTHPPSTQETLRLHPIATGLPRVAVKDDVIPLAHPIISTTGETISEIPVKAGQVFYASFAGYQRYD